MPGKNIIKQGTEVGVTPRQRRKDPAEHAGSNDYEQWHRAS